MTRQPYETNLQVALKSVRLGKWFDNHQIVREGPGMWYCGEPGSSNRHFRVIMVPGRIILTGDIGDLILHVYHRKPLRWARGSRFNPEEPYYPMSKLSPDNSNKEFKVEEATQWLEGEVKQARQDGDKKLFRHYAEMLRTWRDFPDLDHPARAEQEFYEILYNNGEDDPPSFRDHDVGTYFRYIALCWFMSHVDPADDRFKEELEN